MKINYILAVNTKNQEFFFMADNATIRLNKSPTENLYFIETVAVDYPRVQRA